MAMTDDPTDLGDQHEPEPSPAPTLSWADGEVLAALRRLARARAELASAEARSGSTRARAFDPADVARLEQVHAELGAARGKAAGRFGKGASRQRVRDLEAAERSALDRLAVTSYDDYQACLSGTSNESDPAIVDFARRELESAEQAWREVQALAADPGEAPAEAPPEIDLTKPAPPHRPGVA